MLSGVYPEMDVVQTIPFVGVILTSISYNSLVEEEREEAEIYLLFEGMRRNG